MSSLDLHSSGFGTGFETNGLGFGICGLGLEPVGLVNIAGIIIMDKTENYSRHCMAMKEEDDHGISGEKMWTGFRLDWIGLD